MDFRCRYRICKQGALVVHQFESKRNSCVLYVDGSALPHGGVDAASALPVGTDHAARLPRSPPDQGSAQPDSPQLPAECLHSSPRQNPVSDPHATRIVVGNLQDRAPEFSVHHSLSDISLTASNTFVSTGAYSTRCDGAYFCRSGGMASALRRSAIRKSA